MKMTRENEHPDLPDPSEPTLSIEEIVGERVPTFEELDALELPTQALEPVGLDDEELILEWYLEMMDQEERLARVRASLLEAIKTLPQEQPHVFADAAQDTPATDTSTQIKKEKAELPPSDSKKTALF